jgi:hypothetical protein
MLQCRGPLRPLICPPETFFSSFSVLHLCHVIAPWASYDASALEIFQQQKKRPLSSLFPPFYMLSPSGTDVLGRSGQAMADEFGAALFVIGAQEVYRGGAGEGEELLRQVFLAPPPPPRCCSSSSLLLLFLAAPPPPLCSSCSLLLLLLFAPSSCVFSYVDLFGSV